MLTENLIFKMTFMFSTVIHLAGFGLFFGGNTSLPKNGLVPNDNRIAIYEIGFVETNSGEENKEIGQSFENRDIEGEAKYDIHKDLAVGIKGSSGDSKESTGGLREKYLLEVRKRIELFKFYPEEAKKRYLSGNIRIGFFINEDGIPQNVKIFKSSGYFILDNAGVNSIIKASPFPKPPSPELGNIQTTIVYKFNALS